MASPVSWPNGLGGTGFSLATVVGDYFSGAVYWLDTVNGSNANAGTERELPVATLAQAYTNASAGDIIVIEANSAETPAATLGLAKAGLTIIGLGSGSTRPRYTSTTGAGAMLNVTAAGVRLYNLYFPASTSAPTSRISTTAAETEINGCYFEHGASDTTAGIIVAASGTNCRLINNSHVVTASRPAIAVSVTGAVTDLYCKNLTFDGGSYGWTDYALKVSAAATRIMVDGLTLANRSDFGITITGTSYKIFGVTTSGSGRVVLTA